MVLEKRGERQVDEKVREVTVSDERCLEGVLEGRQNVEKDVERNEVSVGIARYVMNGEILWMDSETVVEMTICDESGSPNF